MSAHSPVSGKKLKVDPVVIGLAVIAWGQLLAMLDAIDKSELQRFDDILASIIAFFYGLQIVESPYASLALAFNVCALGCMSIPMIVYYSDSTKSEEYRQAELRGARIAGIIGYELWVFSFLSLIAFYHPRYLLVLVLGLIVCAQIMVYHTERKRYLARILTIWLFTYQVWKALEPREGIRLETAEVRDKNT